MSLDDRLKIGIFGGAICLALAGCGGCVGVGIGAHMDRETYRITVQEKQVKRYNKSDTYLIFGVLPDGSKKVFENTDSILELKWDSSDIYAQLEEGKTYDIRTYGWRSPFLSWYENILSAKPVEKDKKE